MIPGTTHEIPEVWSWALDEPALRDLPAKVETNEYEQLIVSPHKLRHSVFQFEIAHQLRTRVQHGRAAAEFAVLTPAGVKVPDAIWISDERFAQIPDDAAASPVMPEIVVEVLSRSNTGAEMEQKRRLYFEGGAREVWMCDRDGRLTFYDERGEVPTSVLVADFPERVE